MDVSILTKKEIERICEAKQKLLDGADVDGSFCDFMHPKGVDKDKCGLCPLNRIKQQEHFNCSFSKTALISKLNEILEQVAENILLEQE